jgi:hypothetical protein
VGLQIKKILGSILSGATAFDLEDAGPVAATDRVIIGQGGENAVRSTVEDLAVSPAFSDQYPPRPAVDGTVGQVLAIDSLSPLVTEWVTGGGGGGGVDTSGTPVANDFARFTDADTIEGRSYSEVRSDLGLVIGTNVQAQDAELSAIAGLTSAADRLAYFTGSGTAALATFTAAGRNLIDDVDAAAQRTTLGLGNAATLTVDADLATFSLPASTTISAFGRTLVDDADNTAARTTLGLGSIATAAATDYQARATFPDSVSVALSDMTTQITTGTIKAYWVNPFDAVLTITKVKATLATAGSGATVVDINEGAGAGTSILSTKITIDASETDSDDATTPPVVSDSSIAADGRLTFDIDTAGTSAAGLMVHILFTRPV